MLTITDRKGRPLLSGPKTGVLGTVAQQLGGNFKRESIISIFGSFLRALVGLHHQSLLGAGSRHCYGIITLSGRCRPTLKWHNFKFSISVLGFTECPLGARGRNRPSLGYRDITR